MKRLIIFLFLFSAILLAQPGPPIQVLYVAADPSGACGPAYITENVTTGVQTACVNGTWTQNNNAGTGSGTVLSVVIVGTAGQITATGTCTITVSGTCTLSIPSTFTFPGTVTNPLNIFGATTSAQLAGVISDETGTGALVFATSPSFTTPNIGTATGSITGNAATATAATNIAGGSSGQIPYQTGAGATGFDSGLAFNSSTKALGIIGAISSGQGGTAQGRYNFNGATSGTQYIAVDALGANLGVGTTTPTHTLHIIGDFLTSSLAGTGTRCVHTDANGLLGPAAADCGSGGSSPLTTKGDLYGYSTTNARIPIGTDNYVLTADSAQALGLKWAPASTGSPAPYVLCSAPGTGCSVTSIPASGFTVTQATHGQGAFLKVTACCDANNHGVDVGVTFANLPTGDVKIDYTGTLTWVSIASGAGTTGPTGATGPAGSGISGQTTNCLPKAANATTSTSSSSVCDNATTVSTTEPITAPSVSTGSSPPATAWFTGNSGIFGLPDGTCTGTVPASAAFICNNGGVLTQYRSTGAIPILISSATGVQTFLTTPSGANLASALTTALPNTKGGTGADSSAFTGYAKVAAGVWSASVIAAADLPAALANSTSINGVTMGTAAGAATIAQTIASGTTTASGAGSLNNLGSIASTACATLTVSATGVATTDVISFTPNASLNAVVGFVPATTGGINIVAHPTAGNVVFDACNWSSGALTIGTGAALNWRVSR